MPKAAGVGASLPSFAPVLAALTAIVLVAATGLTRQSLLGTPIEDRFYGFFLDRYPLFVFAVVYGAARIIAAAFAPGWKAARIVTAPLGAAVFLAVCLHPTFGGLVLRPGFMVASGAFLSNVPLPAAFALGAAMAALVFGAALGAGVMLARLARPTMTWRGLGSGLLLFLALWFGAALLAGPRALGIDVAEGWPARALTLDAMLISLALVAATLLPHAVLSWARPIRAQAP